MTITSTTLLKPGKLVLFGSGETSSVGRKVFDSVMKELPHNPRVALLETPAGFELNSSQVIGRVGKFIELHLQNYQPRVSIIPARKRGTPFSPDDPELVAPILEADLIFMGPGSPSYAIRQLRGSLAWDYLLARHGLGSTLVLASSAVVAISAFALPVYEIFKVGEELHWLNGLDFFGRFGMPFAFVPHWNNRDGGEELDTSRCFMGQTRFEELMRMLPSDVTVIGIDEKTALVIDFQTGKCQVLGKGGITLLYNGLDHEHPILALEGTGQDEVADISQRYVLRYQHGEVFSLEKCYPIQFQSLVNSVEPGALDKALKVQAFLEAEKQRSALESEIFDHLQTAPESIREIVAAREIAREKQDWALADTLREQLGEYGWKVIDTTEGSRIIRFEEPNANC